MVESNRQKARDKEILARKAIDAMRERKELVNVEKLARRTGLSRSYFYSNPQIRRLLEDARQEQGSSYGRLESGIWDKQGPDAFPAGGQSADCLVEKLKKEIARLTAENDMLRKAKEEADRLVLRGL